MTWNELASDWSSNMRSLLQRFPYADAGALTMSKDKPEEMTRLLAQSHDLTDYEAREEVEDWLFLQGLARDAADFRSHDSGLLAAE